MFIEPMLASSTPEKKRATLSAPAYILEPKHDGMRAVISKHNHEVKVYSRVGLEYQEHLPALIAQFANVPDGTVLDGELMVVKSHADINGIPVAVADFNTTMRVMGANPDKAIARQAEHTIKFCVFDIPKLSNNDLTTEPYSTRMFLLDNFLEANTRMVDVFQNARIYGWDDTTIQDLWKAGIEGAILKNPNSLYVPGKRRANTWYKVKAELTADVVVVDYTEAKEGKTGKFRGKIGALVFGAYDEDGDLQIVGQCSGMTDAERDRWTEIRDMVDITTRVIEVKYNDLVGSGQYGTPRHPQFKTERIDKRPEDCTMDQFLLAPATNS